MSTKSRHKIKFDRNLANRDFTRIIDENLRRAPYTDVFPHSIVTIGLNRPGVAKTDSYALQLSHLRLQIPRGSSTKSSRDTLRQFGAKQHKKLVQRVSIKTKRPIWQSSNDLL